MQELSFQGSLLIFFLELMGWFGLAILLSHFEPKMTLKFSGYSGVCSVVLSVLLMGIFAFNFSYERESDPAQDVTISDVTGK